MACQLLPCHDHNSGGFVTAWQSTNGDATALPSNTNQPPPYLTESKAVDFAVEGRTLVVDPRPSIDLFWRGSVYVVFRFTGTFTTATPMLFRILASFGFFQIFYSGDSTGITFEMGSASLTNCMSANEKLMVADRAYAIGVSNTQEWMKYYAGRNALGVASKIISNSFANQCTALSTEGWRIGPQCRLKTKTGDTSEGYAGFIHTTRASSVQRCTHGRRNDRYCGHSFNDMECITSCGTIGQRMCFRMENAINVHFRFQLHSK